MGVSRGVRLSSLFALSSRSELFLGAVASSFRVPGSHSILRQQDERMLRIPTVAAFQSYSTANAVVCPHFDSIFLHFFQISNKLQIQYNLLFLLIQICVICVDVFIYREKIEAEQSYIQNSLDRYVDKVNFPRVKNSSL